ncbi:MAG: hypothetical protein IPL99_08125 [Candidatus Competibacteraceae bacterium]|nr:hypothetical protein [Candidatus Competibacteraceae bacterium]
MTTGELAQGVTERHLPGVRLFARGVMTNLGILHEAGHPEPWIIAMDCTPNRAAVLDYDAPGPSSRCSPTLRAGASSWEARNSGHDDRLERLILIMSLAMYWCVRIGQGGCLEPPDAARKKHNSRAIQAIGASKSSSVA